MNNSFFEKHKKDLIISTVIYVVFFFPVVFWDLWTNDALNRSVYVKDLVWVQQMRWGNQIWETFIRHYFIFPQFSFVVSCISISICAALVIDIFEVNGIINRLIVIALLVISIQQFSVATYAYCGDEFSIAYLLTVMGAWLLVKENRFMRFKANYALAMLCFVCSLAMYQAYFPIAITVFFVFLIKSLLEGSNLKRIFSRFVMWILTAFVSVVVYIVSVFCSLKICNTTLSAYRNMNSSESFSVSRIIGSMKDAYLYFYYNYFSDYLFNNSFLKKDLVTLLLLILMVVTIFFIVIQRKIGWLEGMVIVGVMLLFPLAINMVYLMTNTGVSFVMLPTITWIYISVFCISSLCGDSIAGKIRHVLVLLLTAFIVLQSSITVGVSTLELKADIDKAKSIANNIDYMVKKQMYYTADKPLLVVGYYDEGLYPELYENVFGTVTGGTVNDFGQFWKGPGMGMPNDNCWHSLLKKYCGSEYVKCSQEQYESVCESAVIDEMDIFPRDGSVQLYNGIIVVKLSEVE